jgi:hypothetical protein
MDGLAAAAELDPLEFRLRHLTNERLRAVLVKAAETFGWKAAGSVARTAVASSPKPSPTCVLLASAALSRRTQRISMPAPGFTGSKCGEHSTRSI